VSFGKARPLHIAPDQARRTQDGNRHWSRARARNGTAALDQLRQFQRLGTRRGVELQQQLLPAARKGPECSRAIAAQIMQSHQAAMRVLERGIFGDESLGIRQCGRNAAFCFEASGDIGQCVDALGAPLHAGRGDPLVKERAIGVVERSQQLPASSIGISGQARCDRAEIVLDRRCESEHLAGRDEVASGASSQVKDSLPQAAALPLGVGIGPQQRGRSTPRCGPFDRNQRKQRRLASFQLLHRAVGRRELRRADELHAHGRFVRPVSAPFA
jgi:hypothetical protein